MTVLPKVLFPGMMWLFLASVCCTETTRTEEQLTPSTTVGEMLRKAIDIRDLSKDAEFASPVFEELVIDKMRHPGPKKEASSGIEIAVRDWHMRIPTNTERVFVDPGDRPSDDNDSVVKSTGKFLAVVGPDFVCGVFFDKDKDRIKFTMLYDNFDDVQEALVTLGKTKKDARDMIEKARVQLKTLSAEALLRMALTTDRARLAAAKNYEEATRLAMLRKIRLNLNRTEGLVRYGESKGETLYVWSMAANSPGQHYYYACSYDEYGDYLWEGTFTFSDKMASEIDPVGYIFSNLFIPEVRTEKSAQ